MPKARRNPVVLTDAKVRALRPDPIAEYVQGDLSVPGFGVRVRPTGAAVYVLAKRLPGETKPTRITIGRTGDISLADARERAREAAGAMRQGVDVTAAKRAAMAARKAEQEKRKAGAASGGFAAGTFGELAERFIEIECAALARGSEVAAVIRRHLIPPWGSRPLDELRRRDLTAVLDPVIAAGREQAAHKVREVAVRVVNWGLDRGEIEINYLATGSRGRRRAGILRRSRRDRVLTDNEIRAIWEASGEAGYPFGTLVRLLLLLGQRRTEVAGMEWAELDLGRGLWTIPAGRYKTGIEHAVPLPAAAVELLRGVPRVSDRFVFATRPGAHFNGYSKAKARLDRLSGVEGWRLHDLRRTLRTGLAGLRVQPDIAERVVGHVIGGVRGVYDRHAYLDEKRDALDRWAAFVVEPPPLNVRPLRRAG